jgi:uncharacterized protein YcfL
MRRKTIPILALSLSLAAIAGCTGPTVNTVERDKPTYQADVVKDRRIITDPDLAAKTEILAVRKATVQEDMLKIDVEIRNTTDDPADIDYKFEWFDDQGMPVDSPTSTWTSRRIQPRETISVDQIAPTPLCKDFRLKLQQSIRG